MSDRASIGEGQGAASDRHRIARSALAACITDGIAGLSGGSLAVLMVYLSRPKHFEPVTRAQAWESLLQQIDARVGELLREADRFARLSDEKICVVLPALGSGAQAVLAAVRILAALRDPFGADPKDVAAQACVGIAVWPDHARDADELVECADVAARIASKGVDGYHVFRPEDRGEAGDSQREIESQLIAAIRLNELPVYYQPQIEIRSGRCVGAEALLRWKASGGVDSPPGALIGIAERAGLIAPLTFAVIHTVLRHAAELRKEGVDLNLSVNISTRMLADMELPDILQQAIDTWDVPAGRLTFEITESAMIGDVERSLLLLTRLRDMGVRLSMDDFGTGYSSLAYLKRLPLHELKIDRIFVANMLTSRGDRQIVQSVIDLSHNFSLRAVAEGVEDRPTFDELKDMGCDIAQGYLFSPALSYAELVRWVKNRPR
ncbi:MAG TPA: GGDEF domain-containing phosphodiesterase [Burkholderiales bacterium]|nr:GGDEF domain-containing phosphodiesterase [Burkholderiales bacterium]